MNRQIPAAGACFALLLAAHTSLAERAPLTVLWAAPAILLAAMLIAWAAESAQFFIAQGFALAILAWLQTLPEFAVEAVLAWKQQVPLLMANLTGALRLLTGLGWPLIYVTAAVYYRMKHGKPMKEIRLKDDHSVEVIGLLVPILYAFFIWVKGTLALYDAVVLVAIYVAYLVILSKMPAEDHEGIEDLDRIPRAVVKSPPLLRTLLIGGLFAAGGLLIYFCAEPFLGGLLAVSAVLGVPSFVFVQWVAPFVSEFPEKVSAFYWARTIEKAPMALMNMVSSNINQWTLLMAMLVVIYSISVGAPVAIHFDDQQELELLMTIGQSLVGMVFLVNLQLSWWEAAVLFGLWFIQFVLSPVKPGPTPLGWLASHIHWIVTVVYYVWFAVEAVRIFFGKRNSTAFAAFGRLWREHVRPAR